MPTQTPILVQRTRCGDCPIRERAVCAYCDDAELAQLDLIKSYHAYEAGEEIVHAGEETKFVASLVEGVVALSKTLPDGRRQVVGLQFASDFIGGPMRNAPDYDAVAVNKTLLCQFERRKFQNLLDDTPHLRERLLDITMDELDAARDWLTLLGQKNAREKVASLLKLFAERIGKRGLKDEIAVMLPVSRAQMGEFLGLTVETVSRQLSKLKAAQIISFDNARQLRINNMPALLQEAGETE